ncbi:MAG: chorismate mutase [Chloroflexota bacterium]
MTEIAENGNRSIMCRGVRGATTISENTGVAILEATRELLTKLSEANNIQPEDLASITFTTTTDVNAEYPALAARQLGWHDIALLCGHEMEVPGALPMCIRILMHWNTALRQTEIQHIYLNEAVNLRPDRNIQFKTTKQAANQ